MDRRLVLAGALALASLFGSTHAPSPARGAAMDQPHVTLTVYTDFV